MQHDNVAVGIGSAGLTQVATMTTVAARQCEGHRPTHSNWIAANAYSSHHACLMYIRACAIAAQQCHMDPLKVLGSAGHTVGLLQLESLAIGARGHLQAAKQVLSRP